MRIGQFIGNILWLLLGGLPQALAWSIVGLLWCVSIIGIPVGVQCFKFARLSLLPFGKEIIPGGGFGSCFMNVLWLLFGGLPLAIAFGIQGVLFFITIIGIPFGNQCFKMAQLALSPFGARIIRT